ncbi:MAG TPA: mycofactocin precursor MftA [Acidimicrobiales bacterium]|nr:mycofactocin precursor MftA [Acidimicrobiales bacterium]
MPDLAVVSAPEPPAAEALVPAGAHALAEEVLAEEVLAEEVLVEELLVEEVSIDGMCGVY